MEQQTQPTQQLTVKNLFSRDEVKNKFKELLGQRSPSFITSVLQAVSSNALLAKADPASIYHAAAIAATLNLPVHNSLGHAYLIPFNTRQADGTYKQMCQLQIGWKGFVQLAQRSGQYKTIAGTPIYEGQLAEENPLTGFVFDFKQKKSNTVIGYASFFQLLNGFEKTLYMTADDVRAHGLKYSQTFKKGFGMWKDDFEAMALKTVIKLLLSKYGPLSIEMQKGMVVDQAVINDTEATDVTYVDNEPDAPVLLDKAGERFLLLIEDAQTVEQLDKLYEDMPVEYTTQFNEKRETLKKKK